MEAVEILQFLRDNKSMFQQSMGVQNIGLFGSHVNGIARADSDIDIFVEMPPDFSNLIRLQQYLETQLGHPLDSMPAGVSTNYLQPGSKHESVEHWDMITDMTKGGEIWADGERIYLDERF